MTLGGAADDSWPCHYAQALDTPFFLRLPQPSEDLLDLERSRFRLQTETVPPILYGVTDLAFISRSSLHCFRAPLPGDDQTCPELFVSDVFERRWEQLDLTGAQLRRLRSVTRQRPRHSGEGATATG